MTDSLRILFVSRCPPYPLHFGDRLILWHLARVLQQRGHTLDLIALAQFPSDHDEITVYQDFFRHVHLVDEPARSSLHYLKRLMLPTTRFPKTAQAAWSTEMWNAIADHLRDNEYDVVHVFGGIQVYEFAHLFAGTRAIITPYESFSLYLKRMIDRESGVLNQVRRFVAQQYEQWMFTPYAEVVVLAEPDRTELQTINSDLPVQVIPNGIDLAYFAPQPLPRADATILFVGNYEYAPNLDAALYLAQTFLPALHEHLPDVTLQLVGNAPPPKLQNLASDHIIVTGRVPDVRPYFATATVFVCPLRIGAGIKNKVLEALAMGIPIVATPLSVDGITVTHERHALVGHLDEFVSLALRVLNNPLLQQQLSVAGRHLIETRYSWEAVVTHYEALYQAERRASK